MFSQPRQRRGDAVLPGFEMSSVLVRTVWIMRTVFPSPKKCLEGPRVAGTAHPLLQSRVLAQSARRSRAALRRIFVSRLWLIPVAAG